MKKLLFSIALLAVLSSCKEVEFDEYTIEPVSVNDDAATKSLRKSDLQLMSIMFTDVYGRSIGQAELQDLANLYNSFGDKQVIIDRLTWRFVNDPTADLPDPTLWDDDPQGLIELLYLRYLSRQPSQMEVWYYENWMGENPDLEVKHLAFVLLTSEEYKYY